MQASIKPPAERIPSRESLDEAAMAEAYDRISKLPPMMFLRRFAARRALALVSQGRAVDIGCGPGYLVLELARRAPNLTITGVDLSDEMLITARQTSEQRRLSEQVTFCYGNASKLPFADQSVDLIVSSLSLHHWSDPTSVLNEIRRVVRPGGGFMIFDLRRDMALPVSFLLYVVTRVIVPSILRENNEPLGSRNAAYTPVEAEELLQRSRLDGGRITSGPFWLSIEGYVRERDD